MKETIAAGLLVMGGVVSALVPAKGYAMLNEPTAGRVVEALTEWQFCPDTSAENSEIALPGGQAAWTGLTVPHAFRLSGLPEKSAGFYRRSLDVPAEDAGKCYYLFLEGAGSVVDVFVNGRHVGQHKGAYTAAWFDLSPALDFGGTNELTVRVSNRDKEAANCLSQSNLFYTNGGIYRPAWLVKTLGVHIFPDSGSTGVYLTPKNISKAAADLEITTHVRNSTERDFQVTVRSTIGDPDGKKVGTAQEKVTVPAGMTKAVTARKSVSGPRLWDIYAGNLYTVYTEVLVGGKTADAITERTGFRTIEMKNGDFVLNGRKLLVRGVCKHHQDEHVWNAETSEMLQWEMDGMLDLGCNGIRLAHYPHRRFEYNMADERGVVVWAENGLAGQKWDRGEMKGRESESSEVGERITREMVRQNWNHPSIVFWSSGNETYQEVASHYADIIRAEDQSRLITYASAGEIPSNVDFVAGNTYQGWYYDHYADFSQLPKNAFLSETGAGIWISHHIPYDKVTTDPKVWNVDHFEPEEYGELFAEYRFQQIFRTNPDGYKMFLWWNYREFYDRKFKNNRNTKGILSLGGLKKDYYYLYQSFLRPDLPVLELCGRHHFLRRFDPANGIKVYSNAESVTLSINGKPCGTKKNGEYVQPDSLKADRKVEGTVINNVFFWNAPLEPGRNLVKAVDSRGNERTMVLYQQPAEGAMPLPPDSLMAEITSSNPDSPACFIERPIEAQGPFYSEVDGSSDNTFDELPGELEGACWIATKRLSDEKNGTKLDFTLTKPATVYVMYSTGTFPAHTLNAPDEGMMQSADALRNSLAIDGFSDTGITGTWRRHSLWLADYGLMSRRVEAGEKVTIPSQVLDYVVLIKPM